MSKSHFLFFFLAIISGFASSVTLKFGGDFALLWVPGLFFAFLVIIPWCYITKIHPVLSVLTVVLTPVGYYAAVYCSVAAFDSGAAGGFGIAGGVGAGIMLLPIFFSDSWENRQGAALAVSIGWLMGIFMFWPEAFYAVIVLWQFFVAVGLSFAFPRRKRAG